MNNPFEKLAKISSETDVIFVSDFFIEDLLGGAELTSEALISKIPKDLKLQKIRAKDININTLKQGKEMIWIFGNYSTLDTDLYPYVQENLNYVIIEYDYKYCDYRCPAKHEVITHFPCDCHLRKKNLVKDFMLESQGIFYMSEKQKWFYNARFPTLKSINQYILHSVFDNKTIEKIKNLRNQHIKKNENYVYLQSNSWVKGSKNAIEYAKIHNLNLVKIENMLYDDVLYLLSISKGLIYLPSGQDTCPRLVLEAHMLRCEIISNNFVQHEGESNFMISDMTFNYLSSDKQEKLFWNSVLSI